MTEPELHELSNGLARAAQVAWRWLSSDESPWERHVTLRMVERLSQASEEARNLAADIQRGDHLFGDSNA